MQETSKQLNTLRPPAIVSSQPCWWMLAGVVGYKLCDRNLDCDHCAFDSILHSAGPRSSDSSTRTSTSAETQSSTSTNWPAESTHHSDIDLIDTLFYHPAHVWARVEDGGTVRIGLDDLAQTILGRAYAISLPQAGVSLREGEQAWSVTHKAGETALVVPLSGTVIEVNTKLTLWPSLLNREPYGAGWAFMIKPTELETGLRNLFYGAHAIDWHNDEKEKLYLRVTELSGGANASEPVTMPDGGTFRKDFLSELSSAQMRDLIGSFLPACPEGKILRTEHSAILNSKRR